MLAFPPMPEPDSWFAWAGIAYPTHAQMVQASDGGWVRECHFNTGPFVEPITTMDAPHLLAFDVTSQPSPMRYIGPRHARTPHLDPYLKSQRGALQLIALPDGGTELIGTTWYTLDVWPQWYWLAWSDTIIHDIHRQVLQHIQRTAEQNLVSP